MNWEIIRESIANAINQMTWLEALAVFFSLAYVFLAARESIWCWPAALASVVLYIYILMDVKLYAETGLQVFYLVMAIYGWLNWRRRKEEHKKPVIKWSMKSHVLALVIGTLVFIGGGYLLQKYSDAALPYLDAFTTCFAVITTFMVTRKVLENWIYWVVIDGASVFLYIYRDLYLTALLFLAYTIIAVFGYFKWLSVYKQSS